jgi:hypothetical protein
MVTYPTLLCTIMCEVLNSGHLPVFFHLLDHVRTRNLSYPVEKFFTSRFSSCLLDKLSATADTPISLIRVRNTFSQVKLWSLEVAVITCYLFIWTLSRTCSKVSSASGTDWIVRNSTSSAPYSVTDHDHRYTVKHYDQYTLKRNHYWISWNTSYLQYRNQLFNVLMQLIDVYWENDTNPQNTIWWYISESSYC